MRLDGGYRKEEVEERREKGRRAVSVVSYPGLTLSRGK